ncbi:MAG: PAS domain S-box protein [Bacteroidota bacterium]
MNLDSLSIIDKVSPITIFRLDQEGKCIYVNQKWTEISGYSFEETIGNGWIEVIHPQDQAIIQQQWRPASGNEVSITEYRITTKSGDTKWIVTRIAAERSKNDQVIGFIGSATDITDRKLAEHALQASEEMNRKLVENSPNAIVIQELDTTIVFVNKRAIELLGAHSEEEILGKPTKGFIHPDDQPGIAARFKQIVTTNQRGEPYTFRINGFRNHSFLGESIAVPFYWKDKKVVLLVIRDVTEERANLEKVADSEKRLKQFIQYAPVAVAMFDKTMNYVGCSHKWLKDWWKKEEQIAIDDLIGKNHYDLFSDVSDYWKKVHQRVLKGAYELNEEDFFVDEQGETHWLRWEARPWRRKDDDIGGVIIFTEFITQRKKAENDLKVMADQLLVSNEELRQFAHITSHNLRAPVVNLDTLLSFYDPKMGYRKDNKEVFDKIIKSVDQLKSSLNELIKLVDLREAKSLPTRQIHFVDVLNLVLRAVETQIKAENTQLSYNFDEAPSVIFEASVLESILQNLITNALKYRREAPLHINLTSSETEDYILLKVADNGIGMDLDVVGPKLFGMYQRFNDTKEGKGLGLYIVKSQIESLGGKIEVSSIPNKGSTFTIYFKKN